MTTAYSTISWNEVEQIIAQERDVALRAKDSSEIFNTQQTEGSTAVFIDGINIDLSLDLDTSTWSGETKANAERLVSKLNLLSDITVESLETMVTEIFTRLDPLKDLYQR